MRGEDGGVVIDGEGPHLLGSLVECIRPDLVKWLPVKEVAGGRDEANQRNG